MDRSRCTQGRVTWGPGPTEGKDNFCGISRPNVKDKLSGVSQSFSVNGSSDAAFRCQYCSNLKLIHTAMPDRTKNLSVSCLTRRCKLDSRQLKTVADRKFEVWTHSEQCSSSHRRTRHDTDRTVLSYVSSVAVWMESADHPTSAFCIGACRAAQCDRRTHSDAEHTCWAVGPTQFNSESCRVWRAVWTGHYMNLWQILNCFIRSILQSSDSPSWTRSYACFGSFRRISLRYSQIRPINHSANCAVAYCPPPSAGLTMAQVAHLRQGLQAWGPQIFQ